MFRTIILFLGVTLFSCQESPKTGVWRGVIYTQGQEIPFNFNIEKVTDDYFDLVLINGEDRFTIDSVTVKDDSIHIPFKLFDAFIVAKTGKGKMAGEWIKPYAEDFVLPFEAVHDENYRIAETYDEPKTNVSGKWEVAFEDERGTSAAIGLFKQEGNHVTGSFATNHGDYRFLEGAISGDSMFLSVFDGTNAYLFKSKVTGDRMTGIFVSGKAGYKTWIAQKNENATLPDATQLTSIDEGYESLDFVLPNMEGVLVALSDPRFENKVVIVQILGSWCINCMDETKFLAQWYKKNKDKPVEIVGLAFERKDDFMYAQQQLGRHIKRFDVQYPILFAGDNKRENIAEKLPMLENFSAFPTTIYLDKNKNVRKIHTGFNGPGTGKYYQDFVAEFEEFVGGLINEEVANLP